MTIGRRLPLFHAIRLAIGLLLLAGLLSLLSVGAGFPSIARVFSAVENLWLAGTLPHDIAVSTSRWFIGWSLGSLVGISLGLFTGRLKIAALGLEGLLTLLRAIPFVALVPLALRLFGLSETGKFLLVGWSSATVCWVVVHQAAINVPPVLRWRALSLGASKQQWIFRVLLPACHDGIYSALRTSLLIGLIVVAV